MHERMHNTHPMRSAGGTIRHGAASCLLLSCGSARGTVRERGERQLRKRLAETSALAVPRVGTLAAFSSAQERKGNLVVGDEARRSETVHLRELTADLPFSWPPTPSTCVAGRRRRRRLGGYGCTGVRARGRSEWAGPSSRVGFFSSG
jgi:hypothetical protein